MSHYGHDQSEMLVRHSDGYIEETVGYMNLDCLGEIQAEAINEEVSMEKVVIKV